MQLCFITLATNTCIINHCVVFSTTLKSKDYLLKSLFFLTERVKQGWNIILSTFWLQYFSISEVFLEYFENIYRMVMDIVKIEAFKQMIQRKILLYVCRNASYWYFLLTNNSNSFLSLCLLFLSSSFMANYEKCILWYVNAFENEVNQMEMKYKLNANFHTLTVCLSVISIAANDVIINHVHTYYYQKMHSRVKVKVN